MLGLSVYLGEVTVVMRFGDIISFRKELYFDGAVQADWFYNPEKAGKVAENFVFHGKDYFGSGKKTKNTIDTISFTKHISEKLILEESNPISLVIADYGTGKSHLAVTLARLFSGEAYMANSFKTILANVGKIDREAADKIKSCCQEKNLVLVLNGMRDFNLHYELLKAAQKSLTLYGLDDSKLRSLNRSIETADLFLTRNKENNLYLFEKKAECYKWPERGEALIKKLTGNLLTDDTAFRIVNDVYKDITGKDISWDEGISAESILSALINEYCGLHGEFNKVILLFDEFGRYLEYASNSDAAKSGDSALQQIFEVAQNSDGALQIINFIQSDIKTYLMRVDQTRNISRYIGRYDQADKYYLSSNLETVFANLIERKAPSEFSKYVVEWQSEHEEDWKVLYENLRRWTSLSGVWNTYESFRKLIVEGIYPLHPVSSLLLTQLSDYLQNRSSITLLSQQIARLAEYDLSVEIPLCSPETLMRGDLYREMYATEQTGRQQSQYCIDFESIIRKVGDKLSDDGKAVLRSNLIIRTLNFATEDYADAKAALQICSGLTEEILDQELAVLENEYDVLGFDEHAGCFDFLADSAGGAHDYRIQKKRIEAKWELDLAKVFSSAKILEIGEVSDPLETAFSDKHYISTNEWKYKQEVCLAEEISTQRISHYIDLWKNNKSADTEKGRLIWVYVNKNTESETVENLKQFAEMLNGTPILMMLLNDTDDKLFTALKNYDLLEKMDQTMKTKYSKAYEEDCSKAKDILQRSFDTLKKARLSVRKDGFSQLGSRLNVSLSNLFEEVYPKAISFNFDGLLTSGNNFTGNGRKYFCHILRMLIGNKLTKDDIRDCPPEIKNRINALFVDSNATSWKCISGDTYTIKIPADKRAKEIYDFAFDLLKNKGKLECKDFFSIYCAPPYGMCEEAAILFLGVVLANNSYCLRIECNGKKYGLADWKNEVINDKKLNVDCIYNSKIFWVDVEETKAKFQIYRNRLDPLNDIFEIIKLETEVGNFITENGIPEEGDAYLNYLIMKDKFYVAHEVKDKWEEKIDDLLEKVEKVTSKGKINIYYALEVLDGIDDLPVDELFIKKDFTYPEELSIQVDEIYEKAERLIRTGFSQWLKESIYCQNVANIALFEKHCNKCANKLKTHGFADFAKELQEKCERELRDQDEIKRRQNMVSDSNIILETKISYTNYSDVIDLLEKVSELKARYKKYSDNSNRQMEDLQWKLKVLHKKLQEARSSMDEKMNQVWDELATATTKIDMNRLINHINEVLEFRLPKEDAEDYESLKQTLVELKKDIEKISEAEDSLLNHHNIITALREKYETQSMEVDVEAILEDAINESCNAIKQKEARWCEEYLSLGDKSRNYVHKWKEKTRVLPEYLSDKIIEKVKDLDKEADLVISNAMIEDVVFYFDKLNVAAKKKCISILTDKLL